MPKSFKPPAYRLHKASGQAVVTIRGKDHYLGPHGSAASHDAYAKLIGGLAENAAQAKAIEPTTPLPLISIAELLSGFLAHAEFYFVDRAGQKSKEYAHFKKLIRRLRTFCGESMLVREFGPKRLREFRETLIGEKLARTTINLELTRVRAIFKWGVSHELVPADVLQALQAVEPLKYGKCQAKETEPVKPVPDAYIEATIEHCSRQVAAMIELQRVTGMRSGEVTIMRTCDINTGGNVWTYTPAYHKTDYRGHKRVVHLGPQAQAILRPWLRTKLDAFLFSPAEAEAERRAALTAQRKTPLSCGNTVGSNRAETPQKLGERYDSNSYQKAIRRAVQHANNERAKQGLPPIHWHPHQLRHNAATRLRKEFGLEVARVVLGHKHIQITERYAEQDHEKAAQVMARIG